MLKKSQVRGGGGGGVRVDMNKKNEVIVKMPKTKLRGGPVQRWGRGSE